MLGDKGIECRRDRYMLVFCPNVAIIKWYAVHFFNYQLNNLLVKCVQ